MFTDTIPRDFPGKEFAIQAGTPPYEEYVYELDYIRYGRTTTGQTVVVPDISYRAFAEMGSTFQDAPYADALAPKIGEELLDDSQKNAIAIADTIKEKRDAQDPSLNSSFAHLREMAIDKSGLLYIASSEEGAKLHDKEPFAAVMLVRSLCMVDFATEIFGQHVFFKYDQADVRAFVPEHLRNTANAYVCADMPRIVMDSEGEYTHHIAKFMLFNVMSDMGFPRKLINVE
jgi:hypothetical protein